MPTSLLKKYEAGGNPLALAGSPANPLIPDFAGSGLHDRYSITSKPYIVGKPPQSQLDLNGVVPIGSLNDPSYGQMNDSFKDGPYLNNLPE
tara:strand:+ start:89 stop:361 length:273 start_codon:yes stop_codon:yes gene_type:complete